MDKTHVQKPLLSLLAVALVACCCKPAAQQEPRAPSYRSVLIRGVPHVKQKPDYCGEACAEMALRKLGYNIDQDQVFKRTGVSPELGRGAYTAELARGLRRLGFEVGKVWYTIARARAQAELEAQFVALHADLLAGVPSIICTHYDKRPKTTEHFRLVLGYDRRTDEVIYHEPALRHGAYLRMPRARLLGLWPLKYKANHWTLIRIRLELVRPPRTASRPPDAGTNK